MRSENYWKLTLEIQALQGGLPLFKIRELDLMQVIEVVMKVGDDIAQNRIDGLETGFEYGVTEEEGSELASKYLKITQYILQNIS